MEGKGVLLVVLLGTFLAISRVSASGIFSSWNDEPDVGSDSRLYPLDVGLTTTEGSIACFGDFDSDKYNDLFILSADKHSVNVHLWNPDNYKFQPSKSAIITRTEDVIDNVAATDFNYDGKLDVLVSGPSNNSTNNTRFVYIYLGDYNSFGNPIILPEALSQLLIMDANADLRPDLFGTASSGSPAYWINNGADRPIFTIKELSNMMPLAQPAAAGFVDMDGDCLSDLFIVTNLRNQSEHTPPSSYWDIFKGLYPVETQYNSDNEPRAVEVWRNTKTEFKKERTFPLMPGAQQPTFADWDGDGTTDVLFPICVPYPECTTSNMILIVFNEQPLGMCAHSWESNCRATTELCEPDSDYLRNADFMSNHTSKVKNVAIVHAEKFGSTRFYVHPDHPLTIRAGDYNLDGYPDLLVPIIDKDRKFVQIWENVGCSAADSCRRTFKPITSSQITALTSINDAYAAAFFDLGENGTPDVLVLLDSSEQKQTRAVYNNIQYDAFFLKTLGLNGVCVGWCETNPKFPDPKPYGVNYAGGVFKFTVTDLSGVKRMQTGGQMTQSAHLALHTPYTIFGLGRTSNYIEDFYYGITINQEQHYNNWICIIPNSQLVAIPHSPSSPTYWQLELYIAPSGLAVWVVLGIILSLILIGAVVTMLHYREKREDEKEKEENAHIFSFSAL